MSEEHRSALVVDDDPVFRLWAQRVLEHDGFEVQAAQDLESALAKVQSRQPGIVIVDITLGREDGFAVARKIRDAVPGLPLVIVSALVEIKHASRVYMGLPRPILLGKPMAAGALIRAVNKAIASVT